MADGLDIDAPDAGGLGHLMQRATGRRAPSEDITGSFDLFGDVREIKVDREGPGEQYCRREINRRKPRRCPRGISPHLVPNLLDEFKEGRPLLTNEGLAEQRPELANLGAKSGVCITVVTHSEPLGHAIIVSRGRFPSVSPAFVFAVGVQPWESISASPLLEW